MKNPTIEQLLNTDQLTDAQRAYLRAEAKRLRALAARIDEKAGK